MADKPPCAEKLGQNLTAEQVAIWAKTRLGFTNEEAAVIEHEKVSGSTLLEPPVRSIQELRELLPNVPDGQLIKILVAVEKTSLSQTKESTNAHLQKCNLIEAKDPRFSFCHPCGRLTIGGWKKVASAPFYNRQNTLLYLLNDVYSNYNNLAPKPIHALTVASPGFGKTRLLVEWAIQVFHHPDVLFSFLTELKEVTRMDHTLAKLVDTSDPKQRQELFQLDDWQSKEFESRLHFIAQLHRTLKQGRVISCSASTLTNLKDSSAICMQMLKDGIRDNFSCEDFGTNVESLYAQFQQLVDEIPYEPVFSGVVMAEAPIALINIDEIQCFSARELSGFHSLAHGVLSCLLNINSKAKPTHIFMVGLKIGQLHKVEDSTLCQLRLNLPLEPLHDIKYLKSLCSLTLNHYFLAEEAKPTDKGQLSQTACEVLATLWIRTLGIPRAIEYLFSCISNNKAVLTAAAIPQEKKLQLLTELQHSVLGCFNKTKGIVQPPDGFSKDDWGRVCLEAALCLPKDPTSIIGEVGKTYADLEAEGHLLPFLFDVNDDLTQLSSRMYTLPFYFYPDLKDFKPRLLSMNIQHEQLSTWEPSLLEVIGGDTADNNFSQKEEILQNAAASALWLRYRLGASAEGEFVAMSDVIKGWHSMYYLCLNGILQVPRGGGEPLKIDNYLAALTLVESTRAIIVNKQKSSFFDVMVPLFEKKNNQFEFASMLGIQCRTAKQMIPANLFQEIKEMDLANKPIIFMLLAPNTSTDLLGGHLTDTALKNEALALEAAGKIMLSNGEGWLSPLFLKAFQIAEALNTELQPRKGLKRKNVEKSAAADVEDEDHVHAIKKMRLAKKK